jgi:hypothetical protein
MATTQAAMPRTNAAALRPDAERRGEKEKNA